MRADRVLGAGAVSLAYAYERHRVCDAGDAEHVAGALRAHPYVAPDSVRVVLESHRVIYMIDELTVDRAEVAAADEAIRYVLDRVVSAHRYPL